MEAKLSLPSFMTAPGDHKFFVYPKKELVLNGQQQKIYIYQVRANYGAKSTRN